MIRKGPQAPIQSIWRWPCMTMARVRDRRQLAHEPAAIDERGSDAFGESLHPRRVLDHVMVNRDDP